MRRGPEEAEDPRWVSELDDGPTDPLGVYAHTYRAISGIEPGRPRGSRLRRIALTLLVAATVAGASAVLGLRPSGSWLRGTALGPAREPGRPLPVPRSAYAPEVIGTTPTRPKAVVRVGHEAEFAVAASGPDLRYGWTLDGRPAATGPRWSWSPQPADVGRRRVEVVITGREGAERRAWAVRVDPARPPSLLEAEPAAETVRTASESPIRLRVAARPATPGERLRTTWEVNGAPAGEGEVFALRPERPGVTVVRAVVRSDLGPAATREWRIDVAPPPPPPVEVARAPEEPPVHAAAAPPMAPSVTPGPAPDVAPPEPARAPAPTVRDVPRPAPAPPVRYASRTPDGATPEEEVHRWLERYAGAWRAHDVDALRRMGQIGSDSEADALRAYFETVHDLDVEVNLVAVRTDGERTIVRFTRRDRFRDPAGRLVVKESPMLEKQIVRTPDGLRFVRPTG